MSAEVMVEQRRRLQLSPEAKDGIAGSFAGALGIVVTQPLDTIRVRLQQPQLAFRHNTSSMLLSTVRQEGVGALWKGLSYPLAFAAVQSAVLFQVYGSSLRMLSGDSASCSSRPQSIPVPWQGFIAGSVAGVAQVAFWSPIELLKLRVQLQTVPKSSPSYISPAGMVGHIYRSEGVAGLFRGFTVTAIRDIPSFGAYFGIYHLICQHMSPGMHPEQAPALTQVVAGGTSGILAWLLVYPLDVVKCRMQAVGRISAPGRTWIYYLRQCWAEGGTRVLFRGVAPTLVRAFVMDSCGFVGYTHMLQGLHKL